MSARKSRRAVLAELVLLADPAGFHAHSDGTALSIEFDTIAELQAWLAAAGLESPDLLTGVREGVDDGRPYRSMHAYPNWHGWEIYASAVETGAAAAPLDPEVADRLAAAAAAEDGAE